MKKITRIYYKLPLDSIPFKEIPSLEEVVSEFVYCSLFSLIDFTRLDLNLLRVYDLFDKDVKNLDEIQSNELLFGEVVSDRLPLRGKGKCIKLGSIEEAISPESLPDLKYNSSDNWFYMKEGNYVVLSGIRSEFEKVNHLERIAIYGENIIRLRIVIELLKKNVKRGLLTLSVEEYKEIGFKALRADPSMVRANDRLIMDGIDNWVPSMLTTPLYEDIPKQYRGKIKG